MLTHLHNQVKAGVDDTPQLFFLSLCSIEHLKALLLRVESHCSRVLLDTPMHQSTIHNYSCWLNSHWAQTFAMLDRQQLTAIGS